MPSRREVLVLGAGIAGLTAAYRLRGLDVEVVDAAAHPGGRTRSIEYPGGGWANLGAQYLSADKVAVIELAEELGVELVPSNLTDALLRGRERLGEAQTRDLEAAIARLEAEQAHPRDPGSPGLDDLTFAQWLEGEAEHVVHYFDHWCSTVMCVGVAETSLYGALLLWGDQRSAAFTNEPVRRSNRGDSVVRNGTQRIAAALVAASGATLSLGTRALSVTREGGRYRALLRDGRGERVVSAAQVVVALPAPVAAQVVQELPEAKREALLSVRYGRFLATPIRIAPLSERRAPWPQTWCRPRQVYDSTDFALRTPGDMDREGGCFHSFVYDAYARQIWDDEDHSIRTGAVRALLRAHPRYEGRIRDVGLARWEHGLPVYSPGRMKRRKALEASVEGLHFCGDYVLHANTDGAVRSAGIAARRVLDRHRGSAPGRGRGSAERAS